MKLVIARTILNVIIFYSNSLNNKYILPLAISNHKDRYHEEYDYKRRLRKRRTRLLAVTEDTFTPI